MVVGTKSPSTLLRVAIIGGGPAGLGAAIALSALPNMDVTIYEKASELREIGAGIRIGYNCWRVLELLGAADHVRGHRKEQVLHRNGVTGKVVLETDNTVHDDGVVVPRRYLPLRVRRTRLQWALLQRVPAGVIRLKKELVSLERLSTSGSNSSGSRAGRGGEGGGRGGAGAGGGGGGGGVVRLWFADGTETSADLVIGGDGIRSVVRESLFPEHTIRFTGTTIWRTLIPISSVRHMADVTQGTSWWHGPDGHVYLSPVDDPEEMADNEERMFEISCRRLIDPATVTGKVYSWGIPATNERVESHFVNYDQRPRAALSQVPEGSWKEFAAFAGTRLERITGWDSIALLGDASHPLTGAFGSGAAFALEDGWILARAIEYTRRRGEPLGKGLEIFDAIRSPYYARMYHFLDERKQHVQDAKVANPGQTLDEEIVAKLGGLGVQGNTDWIYFNDIGQVWDRFLQSKSSKDVETVNGRGQIGGGAVAGLVAA